MKRITKPDVTNTDPEYWEEVLRSHNLGLRQTGLHDEGDEASDENFEEVAELENERDDECI